LRVIELAECENPAWLKPAPGEIDEPNEPTLLHLQIYGFDQAPEGAIIEHRARERFGWQIDQEGLIRRLVCWLTSERGSETAALLTPLAVILERLSAEQKRTPTGDQGRQFALDETDRAILSELAKRPSDVLFQVELEARIDVSRPTISKRLKDLREAGLVARPKGDKGEAITEYGRQILEST
jgi:uncharacterized membrane protein